MILFLLLFLLVQDTAAIASDSIYTLPQIEIEAAAKQSSNLKDDPVSSTVISIEQVETLRIQETKEISLITPNLYLPDYGSKMTSSLYVRGIGARMEQPAMGMYVDNIPILNKNNYDVDFFDIRRIHVLLGPQGTLYGRNTIGGVIDISTLSPFYYEGIRAFASYGSANTLNLGFSYYQQPTDRFGYSFALNHRQSDGFYINEYNGQKCDQIRGEGFRFRLQGKLSSNWQLDNTFSLNYIQQEGYAYSFYDEKLKKAQPVNHNDPCAYERLGIVEGINLRYIGNRFIFTGVTSYQYLNDKMTLDQDFSPKSIFTLTQDQIEHSVTEELIFKSNEKDWEIWNWIFGAFGFYKNLSMKAPVLFKEDGINELILGNANKGIHTVFPDADLLIQEKEILIESDFELPTYGVAAYHQSKIEVKRWLFTLGIRFDFESVGMNYTNRADLHYRFTLTMPDYKYLLSEMHGNERRYYYEITPQVSVMYNTKKGNIYATVSRGYKAGGFNTQIFSDILQNQMMNDLMSDLGMYFDGTNNTYNTAALTYYKPEHSWNYEIGSHLNLLNNALNIDVALFYIDCRNQQLTVFPPGKSTGRFMSNAGRTANFGGELSLQYVYNGLRLNGAYGYTNARFIAYNDGNIDYAGKYTPYIPHHTLYLGAQYGFSFNKGWINRLILQLDFRGIGEIYWNESNTISQPFYGLLGASVSIQKSGFVVSLWGKNLTNTKYNTFYFKSMGNSFVQKGKPVQLGISLKIEI